MATTDKRRSLGRGLSALIPPKPESPSSLSAPQQTKAGLLTLPIEEVLPGDAQPRQIFHEEAIEELASSIREHGILQPIVVRQRAPQQYDIIAGERRWRAAQRAGLKSIPCVLTDVAEKDTLTLALVENLQRQDLNPIEEAEAYQRLHRELGFSQAEIAKAVGKERSTVANSLRLLKLPPVVRQWVLDGQLSMGHARALLSMEDVSSMERMGREAIRKGWSVRQAEQAVLARKKGKKEAPGKSSASSESPAERDVRERVQRALATKVELKHKKGKGTLVLHFSNFDELDSILEKINA